MLYVLGHATLLLGHLFLLLHFPVRELKEDRLQFFQKLLLKHQGEKKGEKEKKSELKPVLARPSICNTAALGALIPFQDLVD